MRFRLREATAADHRRLEAVISIDAICARRDTYATLLARLWGLYAPLEAALAGLNWRDANLDFASRRKAGWLADDLAALGVSTEAWSRLPLASRLPSLAGVAEGMGVLYVLEGASLGGQIISRRLGRELGVSERTGGRFFASYGLEVGERWRAYVAALETFAGSPESAARIERAAIETFACFVSWLERSATVTNRFLEDSNAG